MSLSRRPTRKTKGKTKVVDKWKEKSWYEVTAASYIVNKSLGETPASEPEKLINRVIEMARLGVAEDIYYDINLKIRFRITSVEGNICTTEFDGHEIAKEQIRSQIRRNRSKVEAIQNVVTKDRARLRVSSIVITPIRCGASTQKVIRKAIEELVKTTARAQIFVEFAQNMINGTIAGEMKKIVGKIYPIVMVDIRKSKVLLLPGSTASTHQAAETTVTA
ncbi:MAG: 30S ribosomal protein S3ae [Candidatus Heimdallarchaeota archaeon]|nr:30S ribosomal protein S3ae [Candidatus Heimdallarchaeota archaeon]MCK5142302.1 30S ribosomal protein S3ae [Candidatus Heimdallarchaeota archaeon]